MSPPKQNQGPRKTRRRMIVHAAPSLPVDPNDKRPPRQRMREVQALLNQKLEELKKSGHVRR